MQNTQIGRTEDPNRGEQTVRVSIGTDPKSWIAALVLTSSIRRNTDREVEFTYSWTRDGGEVRGGTWHEQVRNNPTLKQGTPFSGWRWLVPAAYANEGRAIYLDSDQVVLGDIGELFDWPLNSGSAAFGDPAKLFAAVVGAEGVIGKHGPPDPDAVQTSVMLMDCARCDWRFSELVDIVNRGIVPCLTDRTMDPHFATANPVRRAYGNLMQANWIPLTTIARLDRSWNAMNICPADTNLLHFTHSKSQPWRTGVLNDATGAMWANALRAAIDDGTLTVNDVRAAIHKSFIHPNCIDAVM